MMYRLLLLLIFVPAVVLAQRPRSRDIGLSIGVMKPGQWNAITDVAGVEVGHTTLIKGDDTRTGVTAILPYRGNIFQQKVPAAVFAGNGFGKLSGTTQIIELGNLETPIILTNTLAVSTGIDALIGYTLSQPGNEQVQSVNAVVGETNDSYLNNIRARYVTKDDVLKAIETASSGKVGEGNVGAGTGTMCFAYKGGIGTSSRKLPSSLGGYTVGVLVQTNFGGVLQVDGVPVDKEWGKYAFQQQLEQADGSCMMIVATDAPLDSRNLERLAKRAFMGLAKTGGIASNGSGDYVIAFSTATGVRISHQAPKVPAAVAYLHNEQVTPLFMAAIEATEEAIINSLFAAEDISGKNGKKAQALPLEKLKETLRKYNRIK